MNSDMGFLLTLMLSRNEEYTWIYKNKKINSFEQLEDFLNKFFKKYRI